MSSNGNIVIDMDSHIREYVDVDRTYREYLDPAYRESFERLSLAVAKQRESGLTPSLFMRPYSIIETSNESRPLGFYDMFGMEPSPPAPSEGPGIPREVNWDPSIRLADMDRASIDKSLLFPSHAASYSALRDVGFETALHRAYHRYASNYCADAGGRLKWVAIAVMRNIPATVEQLTYWAEQDMNLVGVLVSPSCPDGRLLDNPDLHPLFQCAQDLDLPVLVHGGVLRPPHTAGATELDNAGFIIRAVYQPWSGMTAISALIGGGVFDLFPKLRMGVFEAGSGWMPWLIEQLDASYKSFPHLAPHLRRPPSEIVAEGRLFHGIEAGERYIEHCVQELGEDMWLFTTDYPHAGTEWLTGVSDIVERQGLSETAKNKIFGANAQRLCPRMAM